MQSGEFGFRNVSIRNKTSTELVDESNNLICSNLVSVRRLTIHWPNLRPFSGKFIGRDLPWLFSGPGFGLISPAISSKASVDKLKVEVPFTVYLIGAVKNLLLVADIGQLEPLSITELTFFMPVLTKDIHINRNSARYGGAQPNAILPCA